MVPAVNRAALASRCVAVLWVWMIHTQGMTPPVRVAPKAAAAARWVMGRVQEMQACPSGQEKALAGQGE